MGQHCSRSSQIRGKEDIEAVMAICQGHSGFSQVCRSLEEGTTSTKKGGFDIGAGHSRAHSPALLWNYKEHCRLPNSFLWRSEKRKWKPQTEHSWDLRSGLSTSFICTHLLFIAVLSVRHLLFSLYRWGNWGAKFFARDVKFFAQSNAEKGLNVSLE